jgi:glutaredoxin
MRESEERRCKRCNKEFYSRKVNQIYCSKNCCTLSTKEKYKQGLIGGVSGLWLRLRFLVLNRDNFACKYCGRTALDGSRIVVDHIKPKASGGDDSIENLITSCEDCNLGKADVILSQRQEEKLKEYILTHQIDEKGRNVPQIAKNGINSGG